jgi:hypothetical protein
MTAANLYDLTMTGVASAETVDTRAADVQSLAVTTDPREENRDEWDAVIDRKLIEWGRDPAALEDDDLVPPSREAIGAAINLVRQLRDQGLPAPMRVIPNGDGGIVFKRWKGSLLERLEVYDDGSIAYATFDGGRLIFRRMIAL